MENIKINEIVKKDSGLVIVKYDLVRLLEHPGGSSEATMNTKWQAKEVTYLIDMVGINGTVSVLIEQKGEYTNITKVDMKSAVKGEYTVADAKDVPIANINLPKPTDDRDSKCRTPAEMTAAEILKGAVELTKEVFNESMTQESLGEVICNCVQELTGAYKLALSNVKAL